MTLVTSLRRLLPGLLGSVDSEVITLSDKFSWQAAQDFQGDVNIDGTLTTGATIDNGVITGALEVTGAVTLDSTLAATGEVTSAGGIRLTDAAAGFFGFGAGEPVTIATGVATVTKPYVILDAEGAGTTDQLDSITYTGAQDGDLLLLTVNATDTITVDDANINLAAATRAIAPGGSLLLLFDGTEWTELHFTAATDNA